MASPYSYTNRRRIFMQVALLGILAATIGLAAVVRHQRISTPPIPLGPPVSIGLYDIPVPKGWNVSRKWLKEMPPTPLLEALDPEGGRRFEVVQHLVAYSTTPESYLETFRGAEGLEPKPITIAGQPGVTVEGMAVRAGDRWTDVTWHQYAVTVANENLVLLVHLESPGRSLTAADRKLFRDLISAVTRRAPAD